MDKLRDKIIKMKPNLKSNSVAMYIRSLKILYKKMGHDSELKNIDFLKDFEKVKKVLEEFKITTRKNYLSSIVVSLLTDEDKHEDLLKKYRSYLDENATEYSEYINNQEKSNKQSDNWATISELRKVLKGYKEELLDKNVFKERTAETIMPKEFDLMQMWVAGNLYIGDEDNPPLRNNYIMEVVSKKVYDKLSTSDKKENNYLVVQGARNKFFHLSNYKTDKTYGTRKIEVGKKLNSILNIWLKFNTSGHLLLTKHKKPMNANQLTKYIQKVFKPTGKQISTSLLRHIYISEKFPAVNKEKEEVADKMLHSTTEQTKYSKKD